MNNPPNFSNRTIYHADNLAILKGMNSGSVDLIATDPPFNKNRDFHATPDSLAKGAKFQDRWNWDRDVHEEWMDEMHEEWPGVWGVIQAARLSYGDDMGAFLWWLGAVDGRCIVCCGMMGPYICIATTRHMHISKR